MPRSKGVPAYRLHKPSGQALVIINRRHVYLGPYDSPESREKYQEIVRKHLADRTRAELERSIEYATDVTVAEILVRYIHFVESYYRKHGEATGQVSIVKLSLRVVREKFGHMEGKAFGLKALKACRAEFIKQELCRNEVNRRTSLIRQFFKWATSEEMVPASVWHGLQAVSGLRKDRSEACDHEPVRPVPESVVDATLPYLPRTVAAMVRLQLLTSMQPDEVVQIRGCDLVTTGVVWELTPGSHKVEHHEEDRVIPRGPPMWRGTAGEWALTRGSQLTSKAWAAILHQPSRPIDGAFHFGARPMMILIIIDSWHLHRCFGRAIFNSILFATVAPERQLLPYAPRCDNVQ